jgi:hypothetical protein
MPELSNKMSSPTIIVGLGGTGMHVVEHLRSLLSKNHTSLDPFQFVVLDLDDSPAAEGGTLGGVVHVRLDTPTSVEYRHLLAKLRHELAWPIGESREDTTAEGMSGRLVGRATFLHNIHNLESVFREILCSMFAGPEGSRKSTPSLHIVGSVAGGTGSGMLLDTAYLLRRLWRTAPFGTRLSDTRVSPEITGWLQVDTNDEQSSGWVNAYAAFQEIQRSLSESIVLPPRTPLFSVVSGGPGPQS